MAPSSDIRCADQRGFRLVCTIFLTLAASVSPVAGQTAPQHEPPAVVDSDDEDGIKWESYGELHYNNYQGGSDPDQLDFHRFILELEYHLDAKTEIVAELDLEHAFVQDGDGELELEKVYVDYKLHPALRIRGGILMVPISIMNLDHEPPEFHGVERPATETYIIPTTWSEGGVGIHGELAEGVSYQLNLQAAMDGSGFNAEEGIRGGRQKGSKSKADDFMLAGRLDYRPTEQLWLGAGFVAGENDQDVDNIGDASLFLYTLEARYSHKQIELGASWAQGFISDADKITASKDPPPPPPDPVPEVIEGYRIQAAYDFGNHFLPEGASLWLFVRYELYDTQAEVPSGTTANKKYSRTAVTFGLTYKPLENVVLKADYQIFENESDVPADQEPDQFNLGLGYVF